VSIPRTALYEAIKCRFLLLVSNKMDPRLQLLGEGLARLNYSDMTLSTRRAAQNYLGVLRTVGGVRMAREESESILRALCDAKAPLTDGPL
jgi:hypothetical protein